MSRAFRLAVPILFLLTIVDASLSAQRVPAFGSRNSATRQLRGFLDRDWKYWMTEYPHLATIFDYPGQNNRWTDLSALAIARRTRHLEQSLKELKSMRRSEMPPDEQLNYDLYRDLLETATSGLRFHHDLFPPGITQTNLYMPVNQVEGLLQDVPLVISLMPAQRPQDYEDIIERLNALPTLVAQTVDLMKTGMARGWTPPKITMRDVPKQTEDQIFFDALASPLLKAFKEYPSAIDAQQQNELTERAVVAYKDRVTPAFRTLRDFLVETYIPKCRDTISVADLSDGKEYYKYLVGWNTTSNLTPQELHQIGLDQVKQIRAQIDELIAQIGFRGTFSDFVKFVNTDSQFTYTSADDLLLHMRALSKLIDPELPRLFGKLPRLPYGIRPVPDAVAPSAPAAMYVPGAATSGRAGYIYVNTYKIESRPKWDAEDTFLHEGVPGHHLQTALAAEIEGTPDFRKHLWRNAFTEGWGLYAESLGTEMGLYRNPYSKFGYLSAQAWRAVRLVVDTGIHSMGWTREQALKYFEENSGQPEQNVIAETDRYISWPGQALAYKVGQLKILELRRDAQVRLGERFDIRAFHDMLLSQGSLPLTVLERRATEWIAAGEGRTANPH
jgi:uncharacterized protein (DUF885 family)